MARKKMTEEEKLARRERMAATKAENQRLAEIKRKEDSLTMKLKELREQPIPTPRYTFKEGETALPKHAFWNEIKIKEVLDDGKIYLVEYTSERNNYGKPVTESTITYLSWLEMIRVDETKNEEIFNTRTTRLQMSFFNTPLTSLFSKYYYFGVDMNPDYQRDLVWTQEDKEKLIESIFDGIEIGKFAFVKLPFKVGSPGYEILDGKQRMSTIIEFYEDKFKYKGFYFSQLSDADIFYFKDYNITVGEASEDITDKQKYDYFVRLNTAGKPQDPEHLEKVKNMRDKK